MTDITPYIFRIQRCSVHDGPGIRTTLFFQGCPLACKWCHNPESQAMGPSHTPGDLVPGLVKEIEKDLIFYDESNGGVTFSGGEPLCRPTLLLPLLSACRDRDIHTCLDTCGFGPYPVLEQAALAAGQVLFDIKIVDDREASAHTGKPARPILDNLERLSKTKANLVPRFPLIPGYTDTDQNIEQAADFLATRTRFREIHILPFHNTGEGKYQRLDIKNHLKHVRPPASEQVDAVASYFSGRGFNTHTGG